MNSEQMNGDSGNILIIDDTPANLQLLMGLLSEKGYTVRPIPSGKLALQGIHLDYPDLILLDISMPEMDGYQVCQHLKEDERTRDIPVIFVSAFDEVLDKLKAFEVGGVDYITKPFQAEEVWARVKTHLSLHRLQQELQQKNALQDLKLAEQNVLLQQTNQELCRRLEQLQEAQLQLVQGEKMATLGQLVAGVAHEINNPLCFIGGNIGAAQDYLQDLLEILALYQENTSPPESILEEIEDFDPDFIREDFPKLIESMQTGCDRIQNISTSLRTFSRSDAGEKVKFNLHEGLDSTLLILKYRLKANEERPAIEIVKNYGDIPEMNCYVGPINQVFMNLLSNAIDALDESNAGKPFTEIETKPNCITISTEFSQDKKCIIVRIVDNGRGMPEEVKTKIFEQGFTTKAVGKGTGLGLAIAYKIVQEQHGGTIAFRSELGKGSEFTITIPELNDTETKNG
ncbi:MAG: hybrid sensor histidine kinase/response regulator [Roseofilum sp. SBFL]|uniref:hybrid sensor histidine kinase/response regulator n=1 Tax=Roseofilum sp. SBFL TaxID=2821496 RepID=UPI001B0AC56C|nr:response regulator [Roseofilum sp. SBFL]MBP0043475.1 hybrid sensor histidine kinase/response regulator [Roseofilum sp. SBFL]